MVYSFIHSRIFRKVRFGSLCTYFPVSIFFLKNRIKFFRPNGFQGGNPGCGSILIAFGKNNDDILRNCPLEGKYVKLNE